MENNFKSTTEFKVQVLSRGGFIDRVDGTIFTIASRTIRLSQKALDEYFETQVYNNRFCYEKHEDYLAYLDSKRKKKEAWKAKVCELLDLPTKGTTIAQIESEIFGVCTIVRDGRDEN